MNRSLLAAVVFSFIFSIAAHAQPTPDPIACTPEPDPTVQQESITGPTVRHVSHITPGKNIPDAVTSSSHPKVVFQINQAADAATILRFVTNYLIAEPSASVAVVGYGGGVDFMMRGAKDAAGKPYSDQLQALANKGVVFKVCNNTLKSRNLTADAVDPATTVVPGAVNEIIRLQTKEGYAYFRH